MPPCATFSHSTGYRRAELAHSRKARLLVSRLVMRREDRTRLLPRLITLVALLSLSSNAWADKCATVPVQIQGVVVDIKGSTPIAGASVEAFLDGRNLSGCLDQRDPAETREDGSFIALACWTYRAGGIPLLWSSCGGRPSSLTILVQRPGHPTWLQQVKLKRSEIVKTEKGFEVTIPTMFVYGDYPWGD